MSLEIIELEDNSEMDLEDCGVKWKMDFEECVIKWKWLEEDGDLRYDEPFEIDAEKLHLYLGVREDFKKWFKRLVAECGYADGGDFYPMYKKHQKRRTNFVLSLSMAKELILLEWGTESLAVRKRIKELQSIAVEWKARGKRKEAFRLLTNPVCRKLFIWELGLYGDQKNCNPKETLEQYVNEGLLRKPDYIRDQRLINEIVFTPEAMKVLHGTNLEM